MLASWVPPPTHPLLLPLSRKRPSHYEARVKSESSRTRVPIDDSRRLAVTIDFPAEFHAVINNLGTTMCPLCERELTRSWESNR